MLPAPYRRPLGNDYGLMPIGNVAFLGVMVVGALALGAFWLWARRYE